MNFFRPSQATEWRLKAAHGETAGFFVLASQASERGARKLWRLTFCRPIWGWKFFFATQPTVLPWATFCRASGAVFAAMVLFFALGAMAETTNTLSEAEIQGRQLAQQLCDSPPAENFTNIGVLKTRYADGKNLEQPIKCEVILTPTNWLSIYETVVLASSSNSVKTLKLLVLHNISKPNEYKLTLNFNGEPKRDWTKENSYTIKMLPFAGDFGCADLGLEFFHWPAQKVLPKTTNLKRSRSYTLLESMNPNPSTNGYSRVLSWIEKESGGILEAEAYDAQGKLLKVFDPKSVKEVNGQWQLQEMEIRNVQTGSRTRLEFDLKP
jgi:hypothetical protein